MRSKTKKESMPAVFKWIDTPVGNVKIIAHDKKLSALVWEKSQELPTSGSLIEDSNHSILCATEAQLKQFFAGQRTSFDLTLELQGTQFQKEVWLALSEIPFGITVSYLSIAQRIGRPQAVRAVGTAIGKNPYSIIIPCHRVIGINGKLTGFAGGLSVKQKLLDFEASVYKDMQNGKTSSHLDGKVTCIEV